MIGFLRQRATVPRIEENIRNLNPMGSLPRNSDVLKMEVAPNHPVMSILVFFNKLQVTWPSDRCLGEEHRDSIDLYYAHVQLLSERDLQRPWDWGLAWIGLGLETEGDVRNMEMEKKYDRTEAYPLYVDYI